MFYCRKIKKKQSEELTKQWDFEKRKNGCHHELSTSLGNDFGNGEWFWLTFHSLYKLWFDESEKNDDPCERHQKIHLWLSYLVSEILISSNYTITSCHFENLYPCDIISFAFLAKMLPYSLREFYKLFTDIYFQILVFDLDIVG